MAYVRWKDGDGSLLFVKEYYPYWARDLDGNKIKNPKSNKFTIAILDLKRKDEAVVKAIAKSIDNEIKEGVVIAVVPSTDSTKKTSGMHLIGKLLAKNNRVDGTACLNRHTSVPKLATGGDRSIEGHLKSIEVLQAEIVKGQTVVVIDDVTTSGNSLRACEKLLRKAGAKAVYLLALGQTTH